MKVYDECYPDGVRVECTCEYHVLWETSRISTAGERSKTVWIDPAELTVDKKPLYIDLYGQIEEDDYCGDVGLMRRTVNCTLVYEDGVKVRAGEDLRSRLGFLLCDMWEMFPELID